MTTIAYKDGIIATDGQSTCGDTILSLNEVKRYEHHGTLFFLSCSICDVDEFIKAWPNGEINKNMNISGFVVQRGMLYATCSDDGQIAHWEHGLTTPWAYGSGAQFAIGAMDAGASAAEAVEISISRDTGTGGKIRVYSIK